MKSFLLVHGSTQNPSGWDLLTAELERRGHTVLTVDVPTDKPDASATHYAEVIASKLPDDSSDAIIVAHSASGLFLPLVPEKKQVARLVFLAAVVPKIGAGLLDQVHGERDMFNPDWMGKNPVNDDAVAIQFLFHDCSPEVAAWALGTRRLLFARGAMTEVCPLTSWPDLPSSYIVCTDDRTINPEWSRRVARERLGVEAIELQGGHCPHVSRPAALADVLAKIVF